MDQIRDLLLSLEPADIQDLHHEISAVLKMRSSRYNREWPPSDEINDRVKERSDLVDNLCVDAYRTLVGSESKCPHSETIEQLQIINKTQKVVYRRNLEEMDRIADEHRAKIVDLSRGRRVELFVFAFISTFVLFLIYSLFGVF